VQERLDAVAENRSSVPINTNVGWGDPHFGEAFGASSIEACPARWGCLNLRQQWHDLLVTLRYYLLLQSRHCALQRLRLSSGHDQT